MNTWKGCSPGFAPPVNPVLRRSENNSSGHRFCPGAVHPPFLHSSFSLLHQNILERLMLDPHPCRALTPHIRLPSTKPGTMSSR